MRGFNDRGEPLPPSFRDPVNLTATAALFREGRRRSEHRKGCEQCKDAPLEEVIRHLDEVTKGAVA